MVGKRGERTEAGKAIGGEGWGEVLSEWAQEKIRS